MAGQRNKDGKKSPLGQVAKATVHTLGNAKYMMWFVLLVFSTSDKNIIINAAAQSSVAFFSTLTGVKLTSSTVNTIDILLAATISACLTFFTSICVQRGLTVKDGKNGRKRRY